MPQSSTLTSTPNSKPAYHAFYVRESSNGKGFWSRIGAAWRNRDDSLTLQLDCYPIDGRVVLQVPKEKGEAEGQPE